MRRNPVQLIGFVLPMFFLFQAAALRAEDDQEAAVVTQITAQEDLSAKAAKAAKERIVFESLSSEMYEGILQDPDNVQLNFSYAQQQIKEENFLGATVTLERILMIDPGLDKIRLYYAVVLFRIGNLVQSEQELRTLEKMELPPPIREEVKEYLRRIQLTRKTTRFQMRQTVGMEIDSNRGATPSSKRNFVSGAVAPIPGSASKRRDTGFLNISRIDFEHDIESQAKHQLLGSVTYYRQEQTQLDQLDLESYQMDAGMKLFLGGVTFVPKFYFNHILLSGETYLRTQGGGFRFESDLGGGWNMFVDSHIERQDYTGITESPTGFDRAGDMRDVSAGLGYLMTPAMKLSGSVGYLNKDADFEYRSYQAMKAQVSHAWFLGGGQYLLNSFDTEIDSYHAVEPAITTNARRNDNTYRYRFTYGVPARSLVGKEFLPAFFEDMIMSFSYEFFRDFSNLTNFTYTNHKYQTFLSRRFEF